MKRVLKNIISVFFLSVYLLTFAGINIHKCTASGSMEALLFFERPDCESVHSHSCECHPDHGHYCSASCTGCLQYRHHDRNCCHTEHESLDTYNFQKEISVPGISFPLCAVMRGFFCLPVPEVLPTEWFCPDEGVPLRPPKNYLSYNSQWRL